MLQALLTILFVAVIAVAIIVANAYFWRWMYQCTTGQDETHYVRSSDGWRLALHRYRPTTLKGALPVVLCHGATSNRYSFDLPGAPSLAEFLRDRGFDVWVSELRGSGMSDRPGFFRSEVPYSWRFDDHLHYDVPAIISNVLKISNAPALHWVGHSLGGMLILAHLALDYRAPVASATTLGSPLDCLRFDAEAFQDAPHVRLLINSQKLLGMVPSTPIPFLARLLTPVAHRFAGGVLAVFHRPNIAPEVASKAIGLCMEVLSPNRLWLDLAQFIASGIFGPGDGTEYVTRLQGSPVPICMLGGSKDAHVPAHVIGSPRAATSTAGERSCIILGKKSGCEEDYGHLDLLVGTRATTEVFPLIAEWIESHDTIRSTL